MAYLLKGHFVNLWCILFVWLIGEDYQKEGGLRVEEIFHLGVGKTNPRILVIVDYSSGVKTSSSQYLHWENGGNSKRGVRMTKKYWETEIASKESVRV